MSSDAPPRQDRTQFRLVLRFTKFLDNVLWAVARRLRPLRLRYWVCDPIVKRRWLVVYETFIAPNRNG